MGGTFKVDRKLNKKQIYEEGNWASLLIVNYQTDSYLIIYHGHKIQNNDSQRPKSLASGQTNGDNKNGKKLEK